MQEKILDVGLSPNFLRSTKLGNALKRQDFDFYRKLAAKGLKKNRRFWNRVTNYKYRGEGVPYDKEVRETFRGFI